MDIRLVTTLLAALSLVAADAHAECMRVVPKSPNHVDVDGPGAFGPLQDTVSLGCLQFTSVVGSGHNIQANLVDETGVAYRVSVGEYIGENTGRISEITKDRITIVQLVKGADNEWVEVKRFLFPANEM